MSALLPSASRFFGLCFDNSTTNTSFTAVGERADYSNGRYFDATGHNNSILSLPTYSTARVYNPLSSQGLLVAVFLPSHYPFSFCTSHYSVYSLNNTYIAPYFLFPGPILHIARAILPFPRAILAFPRPILLIARAMLPVACGILLIPQAILQFGRGILHIPQAILLIARGILTISQAIIPVSQAILPVARGISAFACAIIATAHAILLIARSILAIARALGIIAQATLKGKRSSSKTACAC